MNTEIFTPRKMRRRKDPGLNFRYLLLIPAVLLLLCFFLLGYFYPLFLQEPLNTSGQVKVFFMGSATNIHPEYRNDGLYLPYGFIKENFDPNLVWDQKNKQIIITNKESVYHLIEQSRQGLRNLKEFSLDSPLVVIGGELYLPADLLQNIYNLKIWEYKEQELINIVNLEEAVQLGIVKNKTQLHKQPRLRAPWTEKIATGEQVRVFEKLNGWYWVESDNGQMGYIWWKKLELGTIREGLAKQVSSFVPWKPEQGPILSTWEYIYAKNSNPIKNEKLDGVDIIVPTWFQLTERGQVLDKADVNYSEMQHQQGKKLWAVFSNNCQIELTHTFLADSMERLQVIGSIAKFAEGYALDGLDVDFEYMYLEDKEPYVQFIRELIPVMHSKGLTVNVHVIFHSDSENWSMCYDHQALAELADYLTVMAYDQHTALSGSVASLTWVEKGIIRMLEDVPPEKLILGIPFYTRLWKETKNESGELITAVQTMSLEQMQSWLEKKRPEIVIDPEAGQHYSEIKEGQALYRLWLEDELSIAARVALVKKYDLAGIAAWRKGLEKEDTWTILTGLLGKS